MNRYFQLELVETFKSVIKGEKAPDINERIRMLDRLRRNLPSEWSADIEQNLTKELKELAPDLSDVTRAESTIKIKGLSKNVKKKVS